MTNIHPKIYYFILNTIFAVHLLQALSHFDTPDVESTILNSKFNTTIDMTNPEQPNF